MDFWIEHAALEYVLDEIPPWCKSVCDRVGGCEVYDKFVNKPDRLYCQQADCAQVLSLAEQFFSAVGRRDVIVMKKRFVLLIDGDNEPEVHTCIFWYIDRRRASDCTGRCDVKHFFREHGISIGPPRKSFPRIIGNYSRQVTFFYRQIKDEEASLISVWLLSCQSLDEHAFSDCTHLISVVCPAVTTVMGHVFNGCIRLQYLHLPLAQFIGRGAFADAPSLTSVSLPNLRILSTGAFLSALNLRQVFVPMAMISEVRSRVSLRTQVLPYQPLLLRLSSSFSSR